MCTVSMVGDHYRDFYPSRYPTWFQDSSPAAPAVIVTPSSISREEFEALRRDVEDMKKLLVRAKEYDERNGEPHCEMDEKVALLKRIAEVVGIDLADVFPATPSAGSPS